MKVSWRPWQNLYRPYRVVAPEIYELHHTSRFGPWPDDPFHVMKGPAHRWICDLPAWTGPWWSIPAVTYTYTSPRIIMNTNDHTVADPPCLWFRRKNDVLLFKLTWAGR